MSNIPDSSTKSKSKDKSSVRDIQKEVTSDNRLENIKPNTLTQVFVTESKGIAALLVRFSLDVAYETISLALIIVAIFLLHKLVEWLFGENATFFGVIPIVYVLDIGHLIGISRFFLRIINDIVLIVSRMRNTRSQNDN